MAEAPNTVHWLDLRDGELRLVCTAIKGADCRKRPADDDRESWCLDDPDLIDGDCWAVEWWDAVSGEHCIADEPWLIPVSVKYDDFLMVSPAAPEPLLPIEGV